MPYDYVTPVSEIAHPHLRLTGQKAEELTEEFLLPPPESDKLRYSLSWQS